MLLLALSLNRQQVISDVDLDLVFRQARQIGADDEIVPALEHLDVGRPGADILSAAESAAAEAKVLEHAVHLLVPTLEQRAEWRRRRRPLQRWGR